ncbi:uncharacterized protein LOC108104851 [Drosophila eugracilis]|uniref:uncharacterized protein LOC108104851 n=1 Tax=Drosophila eugracilis TaxID=29029 RepID=UPI0007E65889|nr:uncharacterized protein LOC108104851 [Drosophila eugracilis]
MELLDPELYSIDEVCAKFEEYKKNREEQQLALENKLKTKFNLDDDLKMLNIKIEKLQVGVQQLEEQRKFQILRKKQITQSNSDAIENAPQDEPSSSSKDEDPEPKQLLIKCGVSKCLFENCQRPVDSQLLLLHYLCDHNHKDASFKQCLPLIEGERVVLSFLLQSCEFRVNRVLGLLAYGGQIEQQFDLSSRHEVYNTFLPEQHSHLESHIPVVVLVCRTAIHAALNAKKLAQNMRSLDSQKDDVFVFWLVTPSNRLHLNATLCLCGRDDAVRDSCVVRVRKVNQSQNTDYFMPVDGNYFRVMYADMDKISNNFRDELHLEVSLTESQASLERM